MKKTLALLLALVLMMAVGLPFASAGGTSITVYNWGDYIDQDVLAKFEERTGIHVIYETFETNEDMYTKLKKGNTSYDVIIPSDYMVERMINEKMLLPLDQSAMPNAQKYTDPRFTKQPYDPESAYSVPYTWGTMGILYNTTMVAEAPTSWSALWDPQYANNLLMLDSPRDTIGITLKHLGYPINTIEPDQLEAAKKALIEQSPLVLAYVVDDVKDKMIGGEAAIALVWSGDAQYCIAENPELAYAVPSEGSNLFFDAMCIPASSQHQAEAQQFIDFLCEPEIAKQNYEYVGYSIPNTGAIELLGEAYNTAVNTPAQETLDRCEVFRDLGQNAKVYDQIWTDIKTAVGN